MLGKSPAMPDAGGAQSGYLISHDGFTLLLECGGGVFAKLRTFADPRGVDAVLISHLHADHTLDLLPYSFALAHRLGGQPPARPPLWAPPGAHSALGAFASALGMDDQIGTGFRLSEYDPAQPLELGPFTVTFRAVPHYIPTWACDVRCAGGERLTYGADCAPNDGIVELARQTALLVLEATEGPGPQVAGGERGHLTAAEAGELARRAGAERLVLTHYSDQYDVAELRAAAEAAFGGSVEMAAEQARYVV